MKKSSRTLIEDYLIKDPRYKRKGYGLEQRGTAP